MTRYVDAWIVAMLAFFNVLAFVLLYIVSLLHIVLIIALGSLLLLAYKQVTTSVPFGRLFQAACFNSVQLNGACSIASSLIIRLTQVRPILA